jgi:ABC-type sugar transport system ATPase subunit
VDWGRLHGSARERLAEFDLDLDPAMSMDQLSSAQKQEVAIARALSRRAKLLILDEPTASLSEPEVRRLFRHLEQLRKAGLALVYVSHRLDEILELTERVTVLRDGSLVAGYATREATVERMVRDMVGREMDKAVVASESHSQTPVVNRATVLELKGATHEGLFEDVSFTVRSGEIVGLAGLVGAGRSELARAIFGLYPLTSGSMRFRNQEWNPRSPAESIQQGLTYVPEERKRQSLVLDHSVGDSISIGFTDLLVRWGWIAKEEETRRVNASITRLGVKTSGPSQAIGTLSGGNQQKAILARWLDRDPEMLVLDEPTRGVDVGAKAEIHELIRQLAGRGKSVLLISSDLPEVLGLSDRVLVMHEGRITAELTGSDRTQERALLAASGIPGM